MYRRIREERERVEDELLAPEATRAARSRGRATPEEPDQYRTAFQRDRDRIIHSKAFRRLKHKTQVFLNPEGDHYVTRLARTEALGFWAAMRDVFGGKTRNQRCRVHKTANVLDALPSRLPPEATAAIHAIYRSETRAEAVDRVADFADDLESHPRAVAKISGESTISPATECRPVSPRRSARPSRRGPWGVES